MPLRSNRRWQIEMQIEFGWRPRRIRCRRFSRRNPPNCAEHPRAHLGRKRADVQLDRRAIGNDILLGAGVQTSNLTTTCSFGATSRETIVWRRITSDAAITTGSMLDCGREPCAPRLKSFISKLSLLKT